MYLGAPYSPNLFPMLFIGFVFDIPNPFGNEELNATGRESAMQSTNDICSNVEKFILQFKIVHGGSGRNRTYCAVARTKLLDPARSTSQHANWHPLFLVAVSLPNMGVFVD
jgi:hypothetical protein